MGKIGSFGSTIVFETSDAKMMQPKALKKEVKGRWAEHSRVGKKPVKQFLGPDADKTTVTVVLDARHGIKPRTTLDKIEKAVKAGTTAKLVIGGKSLCDGSMYISEMSESWEEIWDKGELLRVKLDLTFEEYPAL